MIKILVIAPNPLDGTSYYRAIGPLQALKEVSYEKLSIEYPIYVHWESIGKFDIIYLQRPYTAGHVEMIDYAHECHKKVWVDYDDDLFAVPTHNAAFDTYAPIEVKKNMAKCLKNADLVTFSTKQLLKKFGPTSNNAYVLPNAFNDNFFELKHREAAQTKAIAWRGTSTHAMDLMCYRDTILKEAAKDLDWRWNFYGCNRNEIWFLSEFTTKNVSYCPPLDIIYYMRDLKKFAPSVAIVPLEDNDLNRSKSNIAYIEMVYAGAVPIVPDWEEWELPGVISYSDHDSFESAIDLAKNTTNLNSSNREAVEYIRFNLLLKNINVQRLYLLKGIL
jgi:hypothetical protein